MNQYVNAYTRPYITECPDYGAYSLEPDYTAPLFIIDSNAYRKDTKIPKGELVQMLRDRLHLTALNPYSGQMNSDRPLIDTLRACINLEVRGNFYLPNRWIVLVASEAHELFHNRYEDVFAYDLGNYIHRYSLPELLKHIPTIEAKAKAKRDYIEKRDAGLLNGTRRDRQQRLLKQL